MITKKEIKKFSSLQHKKFRDKYNLFLAEGVKLLNSAIKHKKNYIHKILVTPEKKSLIPLSLLEKTTQVPYETIKKIASQKNPEGIITIMKKFNYEEIPKGKTIILFQLNDPGNLGTILRLSLWFNISSILLIKPCVDIFNPKVVRASMGTIFNIPFKYITENELYTSIPEDKTIIADIVGKNLYKTDLTKFNYIIFGNETHGVKNLKKDYVRITIPRFSENIDSLNVASSVAIFLYEWNKKPLPGSGDANAN